MFKIITFVFLCIALFFLAGLVIIEFIPRNFRKKLMDNHRNFYVNLEFVFLVGHLFASSASILIAFFYFLLSC